MDAWSDKCALTELVAVLSSAMDRGDREQIAACYAEESYDDHGSFKGSGREFAEFMCDQDAVQSMHHLLGQSVFRVEGDEAWGETFFLFHGRAGSAEVSGYGRYIDYFRRISSTWKVTYRRVVPDRTTGDDPAAYWAPSRDRSDPVYDRRRWP